MIEKIKTILLAIITIILWLAVMYMATVIGEMAGGI